MAVAAHALLVADRLGECLAQRNADVLHRVVRIDVQVARPLISRSSMPWRATWSSMWSKKPMPVASVALPVPSRSSLTVICVSSVLRVTWACAHGRSENEAMSSGGLAAGSAARALRNCVVFLGGADGHAQAVRQARMRAVQILDQYASLLRPANTASACGT